MTYGTTPKLGWGTALALILAAAAPAAAYAQSAAPADGEGEIIVTGSRVARTSYNAPTPVNVIGAQRMEDLAISNVGDALNQLPSFRALTTPSTPLFRVSGAIAGRTMDLRGLGTSRTLVLVDGRRFVPSQDNGTVDLNAIPSSLVQRAEVVTGGASAAYGADAVAGVVNLILDTNFTGFKTDFSYGISGHNDAESFAGSIAGGADFADGRGHFIAAIEYQDERGVGSCDTRDYCSKYVNYIANPGWNSNPALGNGLPANLVLPNILFVENPTGILIGAKTSGGVTYGQQINSAAQLPDALKGLQFSADGQSLAPFQFGNYLSGLFMQGGDPSVNTLFGFGDDPLVTPTSHLSAMSHFDFDITDKLRMSGEFLFSHVDGGPVQGSVYTGTPVGGSNGISINNPFISDEVRAQILAADPTITSILVNVAKVETGPRRQSTSSNDIWRGVIALDGDLAEGWSWDASYTHGETTSNVVVRNNDLRPIDSQAANAITPPAGYTGPIYTTPGGDPVICASSATNPADGCIPANFFGANSLTPQVLAKYYADQYMSRSIVQDALAANLRGSIFELPAGSVDVAVGAEYREDSAEGDTDALSASGAFTAGQTTALPRVKQNVTEGYVEASVPVLANGFLAHSLTVDGAYRWTHYSTSGDAETWKLGVVYEPSDEVLFRITRSSDIRAPNAAELNPNTISTLLPLADPFNTPPGSSHQILSVTGGNPNLGLETADTKTIGVVLQPHFVPNFRVSLDYYDINVDGGIDTVAAPAILQACALQDRLCNLITFSGAYKASPVTEVFGNYQNLATIVAKGFELVSNYSIDDVMGGAVDLQLNANYVEDLHSVGGTGLVTRLDGVTGNAGSLTNVLGVPSWKIDAVATYSREAWSVTAHGRYIPESILDPLKIGPKDDGYDISLSNSVNINTVSSIFYLDLTGTYRPTAEMFGGRVELYGAINNVTDEYPPEELRFFGNPLHYDVIGRAFRLGFRARW